MSGSIDIPEPSSKPATIGKNGRAALASVNKNNLGTLRKLNSVIFPVTYTERFYSDVLLPEAEEYCQLIYYNDIPVGCLCSRIETDEATKTSKLYIMTMGVLAPYRSLGLGTYVLKHVMEVASSASSKPHLKSLYLHVQINNESAKRFYERNGFKEVGVIDEYYKRIEPKAAWLMEWETPPLPEGATATTGAGEEKKEGKKEDTGKTGGKNEGKGGGGGGKKGKRR